MANKLETHKMKIEIENKGEFFLILFGGALLIGLITSLLNQLPNVTVSEGANWLALIIALINLKIKVTK